MAFLCTQTFLSGSDGKKIEGGKLLENHLRHGLHRITGKPGVADSRVVDRCPKEDDGVAPVSATVAGVAYASHPSRMKPDRDFLRDDWKSIWKELTIEFSDEETGASIHVPNRRVRIGPFFLDRRFSSRDMEKIVLHEYLHAAFDLAMREAHHGMMEQVLVYNMGYAPPANPASLD
jgi:hypothetical protein